MPKVPRGCHKRAEQPCDPGIDTSRIKLGVDPVPALNTLLGMGAVGNTRIQMGSLQPSVDSDSSRGSGVSKALRTQPTH